MNDNYPLKAHRLPRFFKWGGGGVPFKWSFGWLTGLNGGKARAAKLTPERRVEIAKKAARARWGRFCSFVVDILYLTFYNFNLSLIPLQNVF